MPALPERIEFEVRKVEQFIEAQKKEYDLQLKNLMPQTLKFKKAWQELQDRCELMIRNIRIEIDPNE